MSIRRKSFDRQYEHVGNIRHGVQTGPWRVEFDAEVNSQDPNLANIKQGSVVSLDPDGKYVAGCKPGDKFNRPVPCICLKNVSDPDVTTGIDWTAKEHTTFSAVGSVITAIPCTSGYEIETTEYSGKGPFYPGDILVVDQTNHGKICKTTGTDAATTATVGFVSIAPSTDYFGNKRIAFFTNFIPSTKAGE